MGQKTYCALRRGDHEATTIDVDDVHGRAAEQRRLIDDAQRPGSTPVREPLSDRCRDRVHDPTCDSIHDGTSI